MSDMSNPQEQAIALFGRCGLEILGFDESPTLPAVSRASVLLARIHEPTAQVPIEGEALPERVDAAWREQAAANGVLAADGTFLIAFGVHAPWLKVRLTAYTRLSAHLVAPTRSRPGHGEFVTLAADGSVMCGVTTEEYDVWIIADAERLHAPEPVQQPVDPAPYAGAGLHPMMIFHLFGPKRLHPPFEDGWVLLGFFRSSRALAQVHQLPASFDDEDARRYAGGRAPDHGIPIALDAAQAAAITSAFELPVRAEEIRYFLEYETSTGKTALTQGRRAPE
jgi:hypothetical protein